MSPAKASHANKEKIMVTRIEQSYDNQEIKQNESELSAVLFVLGTKTKNLEVAVKIAELSCPNMNPDCQKYTIWEKVFKL